MSIIRQKWGECRILYLSLFYIKAYKYNEYQPINDDKNMA